MKIKDKVLKELNVNEIYGYVPKGFIKGKFEKAIDLTLAEVGKVLEEEFIFIPDKLKQKLGIK
jgi:hypothetical protein